MRELNVNEIKQITGGPLPAIMVIYYTTQYVSMAYSASQIAFGAGALVGAGVTIAAASD